jgi:DNA-binding HxlR family transcriptional regulator
MTTARKKFRCECAVTSALDIIGDNWSLVIVKNMLLENMQTFKELYESDESIASNILSSRLKHLEEFGIITKGKLLDNKKTNIYRLTEKGIALAPVIAELALWSDTHLKEFNSGIEKDDHMDKLNNNKKGFIKHLQDRYKEQTVNIK